MLWSFGSQEISFPHVTALRHPTSQLLHHWGRRVTRNCNYPGVVVLLYTRKRATVVCAFSNPCSHFIWNEMRVFITQRLALLKQGRLQYSHLPVADTSHLFIVTSLPPLKFCQLLRSLIAIPHILSTKLQACILCVEICPL